MKKVLAILLAAVLMLAMLAGCSDSTTTDGDDTNDGSSENTGSENTGSDNSGDSTDSEAVTDWLAFMTVNKEVDTWNLLYSTSSNTTDVLVNFIDGLLTYDNHSNILPESAEDWGTEDNGLTWWFTIREGMTWVDYEGNYKGDVTAEDWAYGLEWILNFWKNEANNTSTLLTVIEGAQDYYDYTKNLTQEEAWALDMDTFYDMVGFSIDGNTITYTCTASCPYFESLACSVDTYPLAKGMVEELGVDGVYSLTYDTMWYDGPYTCSQFVQNNEKVLVPNESYWDDSVSLFNSVTVKMVESDDVAWQLYQTGEVYRITLSSSAFSSIRSNPDSEYYDYVCDSSPYFTANVMHFNYYKYLEDGTPDYDYNTAIANENFRQSIYYGLDMTTWNETVNGMNPVGIQNTTFTLKGICQLSDGTDYNDLVKTMLNIEYREEGVSDRVDAELSAEYKEKAIEELTAEGVTFPIEFTYYVQAGNQSGVDKANILKQIFSDYLGDDYVVLEIKTYVSSSSEYREPQYQSIIFAGWNTSINDPSEFLETMTNDNDSAYYAMNYCNLDDITDPDLIALFDEYTAMVNAAEEIVDDLDARYTAFAEAEAFLLNHALSFPNAQNSESVLTWVNDYSKLYAAFGSQKGRYVNWQTKVGGYTREEAEELYQAWLNGEY